MEQNLDQQGGNPNSPILSAALFYALIATLITAATSFAAYYTQWNSQSTSYQLMGWVTLIGMIVWSLWHYKTSRNQGFLRYGQGVGLSVLTGLFAGLFSGIFIYFFTKYVHTGMIDEMMESTYNKMVDQGLPDRDIEMAMEMTSQFMTPVSLAIGTLFFWTLLSLIIGLIASAIMKRD